MKTVILSTILALAPVGLAQADFVGVAFSGEVYRVDDQTGAAAQINSALIGMNSLAGPDQGKLYTVGGAARNLLASIDAQTGALLGSITLSVADFRSAAFSPSGELFATHTITLPSPGGFSSELMKIDIQTGSLTSLGILPLGIGALTFSSDGTLYGWDIGASGNGDGFGLVKLAIEGSGFTDVNPAIGTPGGQIQTIAFAPGGQLYGARDRLFTINHETGAWTPVGSETFGWDIRGIAYVPEPATLLLAVIACVAIPVRRGRALAHNRAI